MAADDDVASWLQTLPLDEPVDVDGESVYLRLHGGTAELGAYLIRSYTQVQMEEAMRHSFQSILRFDAGLGVSSDGSALVLTRMLPGVSGWLDAADALESLINQLSMWRAAMDGPKQVERMDVGNTRNEQRVRMLFLGAMR